MAGTDIATGVTTPHDPGVLPLQDTGSGIDAVAAVTPVTPGLPSNRFDPAAQGGVFETAGDQRDRYTAMEAGARAGQAAGQAAENDRRNHYQAQALPLGGRIGDGMTMPPSPLDPGVGSLGSGQTDPSGSFYTPPRGGAPETYLATTGNEPK